MRCDGKGIGSRPGGNGQLPLTANVALRAGGNAFTGKQTVTQTTGGSLTYPLKIANKGETVGTSVGMLFQADSDLRDDRGKGALVYERKDTWNRGSFHFLQNTAPSNNLASLSNAVMTIANNGNVGLRTTSPQAALDINSGDSIFTGIDLNNTTTPAGSNGYRIQVVGSGVTDRQGNLEIWWKAGDFYMEQHVPGLGRMRAGKRGDEIWAEDPIHGLRKLEGVEAEQHAWASSLLLAAERWAVPTWSTSR